MKFILKVHFIIGIIFLSMIICHHTYYVFFEPWKSVLDKYKEIKETSLEELSRSYDEIHKKIKELEAAKKEEDEDDDRLYLKEPYKSKMQIENAIDVKERNARTIFRDRYIWIFGLAGVALGFVMFRWVHEFLGLPFMLAGFMEMIVVSHDLSGYAEGYGVIVLNRLIYALITLVILLAVAYLTGVFRKENGKEDGQDALLT